ncbi:putative UDP-glucosyltransferase 74F2 [Tripterygium wilfordii]|uniref:Glycosyltransferase n=1 Tax=Tripterygium wilfordii TaxID=458696 RepID=A0A7J7CIL7_TRIWF|nr:UDP-glycosyltransferase 74F2-like [Tripterygium wilfordii]KAF5733897.1 putative UDP-glucosyltransferase 74F2 [Tripterygium wilfordii]
MEMEKKAHHVLVVPYTSQGHYNPMHQFSKRLVSKGLKATLVVTHFISKSMKPNPLGSVQIDTISDGCDAGGFAQAETIKDYLTRLETAGSKTLAELIVKYKDTASPVDCIVYDAFLPWVLDVAQQFGIGGAAFFTQMAAVNYIYYYAQHKLLPLPVVSTPVMIPGLPPLELRDMPSFIYVAGSYPAYFEMVLSQFSNANKPPSILMNTFYKLEEEVVDAMSKLCPLLTIGPTIPSIYLDKRLQNDNDYGLNLFQLDSSRPINWLNSKPPRSVIYVAFGSMANLSEKQMEELAYGLKRTNFHFIWAIRASEEAKIPIEFKQEAPNKGLIVNWIPQLEVLSNEAIGCFFTHCGWNSTIEALSLGVPMVAMPQWTDQTTDAKFVEDIWKVGVRVRVDENGIVGREEIESCIVKVMEGETGGEMRKNAEKWKKLAVEAVSEGGTSDKNIDDFVSTLVSSS